jgi:glucosamine-6-phosphate deaminase
MTVETLAPPVHRASPLSAEPRSVRNTRVPTLVCRTSEDVGVYVAGLIADVIRAHHAAGRPTVLGLATGSTPIGVYRELIRLHRETGLDFSNVVTFNLDEYWPMPPESLQSYRRWMWENFFEHVNVRAGNVHLPSGTVRRREVEAHCAEYERAIADAGGIDVQLLGIGRTGHIGFNEPGSPRASRTRLVNLDPVTRRDASADFYGEENVPFHAITAGVGTILSARRIVMMALGEHKTRVVRQALEEDETPKIAASFLQSHKDALYVLDEAAAAALTAVRTPWLTQQVEWTPDLEKRAVIWLSQATQKPLLKLDARDFLEHHLTDLMTERGPVEQIRQRTFDALHQTICTAPAGRERQTVIVFSPHPDDDVISMGGTLVTLAAQGHDVHVAYMTSGNIAVFDHDALRHIDYVGEFLQLFELHSPQSILLEKELQALIGTKRPGAPDHEKTLAVKALIRKTEAIAAAGTTGVPAERCHFLDLPFYRTGVVRKHPICEADVAIVAGLLRTLRPSQIYVAGDLSDPHGTHRMCAQAIIRALGDVAVEGLQPDVWLYRGAWQEYEPHEIERAVPLSPEVQLRKKLAIFKHESQKDAALFPGHDEREFWVRAEDRTRNTARLFNELGLPEFFAIESFKRFDGCLA